MRPDRLSSIKQKLRQGAGNFDFGALIEGVSTLDEKEPTQRHSSPDPDSTAAVSIGPDSTLPGLESEPPAVRAPLARTPSATAPDDSSLALRDAIQSLVSQLSRELGNLRGSLHQRSAVDAGQYLARVNRVLELLQSVDGHGNTARSLGIKGSPPLGRAWPQPAWSAPELAESPIGALLPLDAGEPFMRDLLYATWGVAFESTP